MDMGVVLLGKTLTQSITQSIIGSLTHSLAYSLTHCLTYALLHTLLIYSSTFTLLPLSCRSSMVQRLGVPPMVGSGDAV